MWLSVFESFVTNNLCRNNIYSIRSTIPLFTLFQQSRVIDITRSLIDIYQHEGYMPDGRSGMSNGITQGGSNADMVVVSILKFITIYN